MKTKPKEQTCGTCKYWNNGAEGIAGECQRFPPVPVVRASVDTDLCDFITQGWPTTWRGAWCYEWKAR